MAVRRRRRAPGRFRRESIGCRRRARSGERSCCSASACSSSSTTCFSPAISRLRLVKSGLLTPTTPGLFGTTGVASFIAALFTGLFIGTILCGFLADKFGRRTIFAASLLWYTAANVMVALQNDAFGLNIWRLISGIGLGLEMVTIGAYLSEMAPKGMRGQGLRVSRRRSASAACRSFPSSPMFSCRPRRSASRAGAGWS